jgi:tRNA threonylcarbamoyladenosine biosynthesis protein TsaE
MPEETFISRDETDNIEIAKKILESCNTVRIFAFYGDLGAGKTTLIKRFCEYLGTEETITSPTFTLVNEYEAEGGTIYHFDFYRIKSEEEAYDIGVDEYFYSGSYNFIEWPEKISSLLPEEAAKIYIKSTDNEDRIITLIYG